MKEKTVKDLMAVVLVKDMSIFGRNTSRLSVTMDQINLTQDGDEIVVTSKAHPDTEERLHKAAILKTTWKVVK